MGNFTVWGCPVHLSQFSRWNRFNKLFTTDCVGKTNSNGTKPKCVFPASTKEHNQNEGGGHCSAPYWYSIGIQCGNSIARLIESLVGALLRLEHML
jgi:hypothetical protein